MSPRRFPPPWSVDEENAAYFIARATTTALFFKKSQ
jgi:hypothetical protein